MQYIWEAPTVWFPKKHYLQYLSHGFFFYVFDRFLVHRYSVLQQHAEANGIDGVDDLDTLEGGKTHYHDDSDEVHTTPHW